MVVIKIKNNAALQAALTELTNFLIHAGISEEQIFDSKLVACELLGNVLRHTEGEMGLQSEIKDGHIELKIFSKTFFALPEEIHCSGLFAEHGRGLFLVNEISEGQMFSEEDGIRVLLRIKKNETPT